MNTLFAFFFLLLPFQFALSPFPGIDLALVRPVALFLCLVWLGHGLFRHKVVLPPLLPLFFLTGFLVVATGSFFWSENSESAVRKILFLLSFYPLFVVFSSWLTEYPGSRSLLLKSLVGGAFLSACSGLMLFATQFSIGVEKTFFFLTHTILPFFLGTTFAAAVAEHPSLLVNISGSTVLRASGVFPDPHMFALYLGMTAPFALAFFLLAVPTKKKFWGVVLVGILIADLLSFSRGAYVGLMAGALIFFFVSGAWHHFNRRQKVGALCLGIFLCLTLLVSPVGARFFSSFSSEDGSNVERLRLWREAVAHIAERPLFGVGLGNYATLVNPGASSRSPIYAHNLYLDIAVEVGLVGLTFFLVLLSLAIERAYAYWKREQSLLALALATSLIIFSVHSFFETPLFSVHVLPVLVLLLAVGVSYRHDQTPS